MDERTRDSELEKLFATLLASAAVIFVAVAGAYFLRFGLGSHGFSQDSKDWAEFGEYMGGTLGGVFGLFAFLGLLITIVQQRTDSARSVKATLDAVTKAHSIETESRQKSILAIAEAANEHAKGIGNAFAEPDNPIVLFQVYDKTIIDGVVRALTDVPVHEIGSREGVLALLSLRDQFVFLGIAIEAFIAGPARHPEMKQALDTLMEPENGAQRLALSAQGRKILAGNVQVHLDRIRANYLALERALNQPIAD
jgi:hypothetical protein